MVVLASVRRRAMVLRMKSCAISRNEPGAKNFLIVSSDIAATGVADVAPAGRRYGWRWLDPSG